MKKWKIVVLVCALFILGLIIGVSAAGTFHEITAEVRNDFTVKIDGEIKEFKNADGEIVYPIVHDGTTYLPLRAIGELMGKTVYWYEDDKLIELKETKTTVTDADIIVVSNEQTKDVTKDNVKEEQLKQPDTKDNNEFITKEKAQEIALGKAGLKADEVVFSRTELDKDNGVWRYEVEFRKGRTEYEADIKADDGAILKWEVDKDD